MPRSRSESVARMPMDVLYDVANLGLAFGTELKGEGAPQLKVRNRAGELVTVHCHPTQGAWHATVMKVVKRLDISPKEFQA